jgi:hypothetical protein
MIRRQRRPHRALLKRRVVSFIFKPPQPQRFGSTPEEAACGLCDQFEETPISGGNLFGCAQRSGSFGADGETRTLMGLPAAPSRLCVCQFHHIRTSRT